jgi:surfeit locus 1 family protein
MSSVSRTESALGAFRPGLWLSLCALAGLAVLVGLGTWQMQRHEWKTALIAERAAQLAAEPVALPGLVADWRPWEFRRAVVPDGEFLWDRAQRFGFKAEGGRPGYDLLVPLRRPDGSALLVNLGFVLAGAPAAVGVEPPVAGVLRYYGDAAPAWPTPDNEPAAGQWYWYDMPALRDAMGLELLPVVLDASPRPAGIDLPNNHLQYAITWYALAAVLVVMYAAVGFTRGREQR